MFYEFYSNIFMTFTSLYKKLFISGSWQMAYRLKKEHWPFDYDEPFIPLPNTKKYWYADPLLFEDDGKQYLFFEAFNKKEQKGELAVMEWENNTWTDPVIIIANNYHMSYPCVFKHDGTYYMIPESAECGSLELYVSDSFPYSWKKKCNIIEDIWLADPTVFKYGERLLMYAWNEQNGQYKSFVYELDIDNLQCKEIASIPYPTNSGRPAGCFFQNDGKLLRPSQDSVEMYGKGIIWRDFEIIDGEIKDTICGRLDVEKVKLQGLNGEKRIHTFSTTSRFEVIDYCIFKFDLLKRCRILYRKYKLNRRRNVGK